MHPRCMRQEEIILRSCVPGSVDTRQAGRLVQLGCRECVELVRDKRGSAEVAAAQIGQALGHDLEWDVVDGGHCVA